MGTFGCDKVHIEKLVLFDFKPENKPNMKKYLEILCEFLCTGEQMFSLPSKRKMLAGSLSNHDRQVLFMSTYILTYSEIPER